MRVDESCTASLRSDTVDLSQVSNSLAQLSARALKRLRADGYSGVPQLEATIEMRYLGQNYNTEIPVPLAEGGLADAQDLIDRPIADDPILTEMGSA